MWDGPVGTEFFGEAVYEFLVEYKSDFSNDSLLRGYDNRIEEWPKCSHGEDCVVQMMTDGTDGGCHFFRCPRAWVLAITLYFHNTFLMFSKINTGLFVLVFRGSERLQVRYMGRSSYSSACGVYLLPAESYLRSRKESELQ